MAPISIDVEGLHHGGQPIPSASKVGPLLVSGGINGLDPAKGTVPEDVDGQVALIFSNMRAIVSAAGGTVEDIVRVTFTVVDRSAREAINAEWVAMFPDSSARPARHTRVDAVHPPLLVQAELIAYIQ